MARSSALKKVRPISSSFRHQPDALGGPSQFIGGQDMADQPAAVRQG